MSKTTSDRFAVMKAEMRKSQEYLVEELLFNLAEEILARMEELRINQSQLAGRLGTSKAYITKILRGNANFTAASLVKIATALDCKIDIRMQSDRHATGKKETPLAAVG
jgi:transcriptional regulator with XRE-family HTH domain